MCVSRALQRILPRAEIGESDLLKEEEILG